jgi:hypothetical protein
MGRRTIIFGDVHGCSRELSELLNLLGPTSGDRLFFVGDIVARGPDSRGVVAIVREIGGKSVLGNHEARLLEVRRARLRGDDARPLPPRYEALFRELGDAEWALLDALPLFVDLPEHDARIVHAGVVPGKPFREQDAWTLTNIRSIAPDGSASSVAGAESWGATYRGKPHVVFGHDARRRLQIYPWATGIDTGCVYGGSLTALVLPDNENVPFPEKRRELMVSVRAREAYYMGGGA